MTLAILGLGTALPEHSFSQKEACELAIPFVCSSSRQARVLEELYRRTEIDRRSSVLYSSADSENSIRPLFTPRRDQLDSGPTTGERMQTYAEESVPLATRAAGKALNDARMKPSAITHLITVSCTGFFAPGFDIALIKQLDLNLEVARVHVGFMGCHGTINGLRLAAAVAASEPQARIILCSAELCTLHFQYGWSAGKIVANSLFADGAAALVLGYSDTSGGQPWRAASFASVLIPDSEDMMSWTIGDNGFAMTLSPQVPDLISFHLATWISRWLAQNQLEISDIASWAIHPGGPRILDAVEDSLGLAPQLMAPSRSILSECGNMSSPTVLFILERLRSQVAITPCVMLGFGPGMTFEAALLI